MKFTPILAICILLSAQFSRAADVYEIKVDKNTHKFSIDAATFGGFDFSPDSFRLSYGTGKINFTNSGVDNTLEFDLSRDTLLQVWHDKTELRLHFLNEKSFKYDKVHGDDVTLRIVTTSKDEKTYEGKYFLELSQHGLKNKIKFDGSILLTRSFRYHE